MVSKLGCNDPDGTKYWRPQLFAARLAAGSAVDSLAEEDIVGAHLHQCHVIKLACVFGAIC